MKHLHQKTEISTYTNAAYLIPAFAFFIQGELYSMIVGVAFMFLAVASFFFHKTLIKQWQKLDMAGVYAVLATLPYYLYPDPAVLIFSLLIGFIFIYNKVNTSNSMDSMVTVPTLFSFIAYLSYSTMKLDMWILMIASFVIGAIANIFSENLFKDKMYTEGDFAHGAWHIATATGFALLAV